MPVPTELLAVPAHTPPLSQSSPRSIRPLPQIFERDELELLRADEREEADFDEEERTEEREELLELTEEMRLDTLMKDDELL